MPRRALTLNARDCPQGSFEVKSYMEVGAADRGRGDADDRLAWTGARPVHLLDSYVSLSTENGCFHPWHYIAFPYLRISLLCD